MQGIPVDLGERDESEETEDSEEGLEEDDQIIRRQASTTDSL